MVNNIILKYFVSDENGRPLPDHIYDTQEQADTALHNLQKSNPLAMQYSINSAVHSDFA